MSTARKGVWVIQQFLTASVERQHTIKEVHVLIYYAKINPATINNLLL